MTNPNLIELCNLWESLIAPPDPTTIEQIVFWLKHYPVDTIVPAIHKTAKKNAAMGGLMTVAHRRNYASRIIKRRLWLKPMGAVKESNPTAGVYEQ